MKYRIVSDSTSNLLELNSSIDYRTVPLKIITDGREFSDVIGLDVEELVHAMETSSKNSTSCPAVGEWLEAFEGADTIFAITITSALSGSYASAVQARDIFLEEHPDADIYVIDSLSTGGEMELIIEKLRDLMEQGLPFEEIKAQIIEYQTETKLLFQLESLSNLAKNGRVPPAIAKIAGLLGIRFIGRASAVGTLQQEHISRGAKKALSQMVSAILHMGYEGGKMRISNCLNSDLANKLKDKILESFPMADVTVRAMTGLCSYYAERGGLIIGFEGKKGY